jgi:predicted ATP-dependent endonuclease of OLD family
MGNIKERGKFALLQNEFSLLFPHLTIDVAGEANKSPRVMIIKKSTGFEVPIDHAGAGIGEFVILLAHLVASEGMIFALDMPELHLHPHAQRLLFGLLQKYAMNNQFLISTHSTIFLDTNKLENVLVVREKNAVSEVNQLPEAFLNSEEKCRLERCLDSYNKDFFFSRKVLVVEGETELGALPVFSRALGKDFDTFGISLVRTGKHFGLFTKLAIALGYEYVIQCDKDALMNIENSIKVGDKKVRTSPTFYNLDVCNQLSDEDKKVVSDNEENIIKINDKFYYDEKCFDLLKTRTEIHNAKVLTDDFEGILKKNGYESIINEAKAVTNSKASCGRIVAEKIIKDNLNIPKEFEAIIQLL